MTDSSDKSDTVRKTMPDLARLPDIGEDATRPAALKFDPSKYAADVDGFDITEAQKNELLLTLWSIMRSFVELGFTADLCATLSNDAIAMPDDEELR